MFSLKNKRAVITGAGSGLGLATAKRFKEAGAAVIMGDISEDTRNLAEEMNCLFVKTDVSREEDVKNLMEKAEEHFGKLDIVVNNAGIICGEELLEEADRKTYEALFNVNVMGVVYGIKYGQKHMKDGGVPQHCVKFGKRRLCRLRTLYNEQNISGGNYQGGSHRTGSERHKSKLYMSQHNRHSYGLCRRL